jgi:hypothetical protein
MPDLVRRAATAVEALRSDHLQQRHRLVTKLAQLDGLQRSRVEASWLAVSVRFLARSKCTPEFRLITAFGGSTLGRDERWHRRPVSTGL